MTGPVPPAGEHAGDKYGVTSTGPDSRAEDCLFSRVHPRVMTAPSRWTDRFADSIDQVSAMAGHEQQHQDVDADTAGRGVDGSGSRAGPPRGGVCR